MKLSKLSVTRVKLESVTQLPTVDSSLCCYTQPEQATQWQTMAPHKLVKKPVRHSCIHQTNCSATTMRATIEESLGVEIHDSSDDHKVMSWVPLKLFVLIVY